MDLHLVDWLPALSTTGLFAGALWLARNLIATRLTKSVEHEFNTKLETLRAGMRESEERLRAELRLKESEINALRSGALSALASRQAALDRRRLEAIDQLWSSVLALAPARALVASMSLIKFEAAAARAEHDPRMRQFFDLIGGKFDLNAADLSGAAKARPYVSPMVWAIYSAMLAVVSHTVMRLHVLKGGLGTQDFADPQAIAKLVTAALPHYADFLKEHGPSVYTHVLEALDVRLMQEIQTMLSTSEYDKASIEQAAEIVRQASAVRSASEVGKSAA